MKFLPISIALGLTLSLAAISIDANTSLANKPNSNFKESKQLNSEVEPAEKQPNPQVWRLVRTNTYTLNIQKHNDSFIGWYNEIINDSIFTGKILTGRGETLINFVQQDDGEYYAVHSGIMINPNLYEGQWFDNNGNSGTFRLEK